MRSQKCGKGRPAAYESTVTVSVGGRGCEDWADMEPVIREMNKRAPHTGRHEDDGQLDLNMAI